MARTDPKAPAPHVPPVAAASMFAQAKEVRSREPRPRLPVLLAVALVMSLIGCSDSGGVDGPVLVSPRADLVGPSGGMTAIVEGVVVFDSDAGCLFLEQGGLRYPVVWPAGARWRSNPPAVALDGEVIEPGMTVSGGGGYLQANSISTLAGPAVASAAAECAGSTGEIAFFNTGSEVNVGG